MSRWKPGEIAGDYVTTTEKKYDDGLGKRVRVNLEMAVRDGGDRSYNPGRMDLDIFEGGAISLKGDGDGQVIYLYPEQVAALLASLVTAQRVNWEVLQ